MGLFDFFKKKPQRVLMMHECELKGSTKNKESLYVGQLLNIFCNENTETYSVETFDGLKVGTLKSKDDIYGEKYNYAILRNIADKITVCVICDNVFSTKLKINLYNDIQNGAACKVLETGELIDISSKEIIGKVDDFKISNINISNIAYAHISNKELVLLVYKN